MGENGAGKSTLLKILAGIVQPDAGDVHWRGERLHLGSPRDALERGIGMVYQEMLCFENLTVAGNIFAGRELTRGGRLRHAARCASGRAALLAELHLPISPGRAGGVAVGRVPAAAPGRARARLRLPDPRARRADDLADRCRDGSPVRGAREAEGARRRRCSTSRTGCRRSSGSAIGSRCCATARYVETFDAAASRRTTSSARWSDASCRRAPSSPSAPSSRGPSSRRCRSTASAAGPASATSRCR